MCDLATEISVLDSFSTHMRRYEVHSENCESAVGLFYIYLGFDFFLEEAAAALGQPPPPLLPALPQFVFFGLVQTEESGRAPLQIPGKDAPKNRRRSWEFAEPIQKNNNRKGFVCWARLFICFSLGFSFGFPSSGRHRQGGSTTGTRGRKKIDAANRGAAAFDIPLSSTASSTCRRDAATRNAKPDLLRVKETNEPTHTQKNRQSKKRTSPKVPEPNRSTATKFLPLLPSEVVAQKRKINIHELLTEKM